MLVDTHANPDPKWDNLAPYISVYVNNNVPALETKMDFSMMELFIELRLVETSDPFRDPKDPLRPQVENVCFESDSDVSQINRGQLCSYAGLTQGLSFTTIPLPIYMQTICKIHFFLHYAHLNHSQRGYDTSVSPASPEDLLQIQHVEKSLQDENPTHHEFCIIMVPDRDDPEVETLFIISFPPKYTARSPFEIGRAHV